MMTDVELMTIVSNQIFQIDRTHYSIINSYTI